MNYEYYRKHTHTKRKVRLQRKRSQGKGTEIELREGQESAAATIICSEVSLTTQHEELINQKAILRDNSSKLPAIFYLFIHVFIREREREETEEHRGELPSFDSFPKYLQ